MEQLSSPVGQDLSVGVDILFLIHSLLVKVEEDIEQLSNEILISYLTNALIYAQSSVPHTLQSSSSSSLTSDPNMIDLLKVTTSTICLILRLNHTSEKLLNSGPIACKLLQQIQVLDKNTEFIVRRLLIIIIYTCQYADHTTKSAILQDNIFPMITQCLNSSEQKSQKAACILLAYYLDANPIVCVIFSFFRFHSPFNLAIDSEWNHSPFSKACSRRGLSNSR